MLSKTLLLLFFASFIEADGFTQPDSSFMSQPCQLPQIRHGRVRIRKARGLVKFLCANRYTLVGHKYATCKNGKWDVPIPVCVRPGCQEPPPVPNSVRVIEEHGAWRMYYCFPGHKIVGSSALFCDGNKWNDTTPSCIADAASAKPSLSCDFEDSGLCGWSQDEMHDFDWQRWSLKTNSSFVFTGPSYDHTFGRNGTGYYMLLESSGEEHNATARLLSPVYDSSLSDGCFRFYYHMYGRSIGGLRVYQKPASLPLFELLSLKDPSLLLFEHFGELGDIWFSSVPWLKALSEDFQIVIEGIRGSSYMSDIAVDDVAILRGDACLQARKEALTPEPVEEFSCAGRCPTSAAPVPGGARRGPCGCTFDCITESDCCPDFFSKCFSVGDFDFTLSTDDDLPETQKLVGESTTTIKQQPTTASTTTSQATTKPTVPTTPKPPTKQTTTMQPTAKTPTKPTANTTIRQPTTKAITTLTTAKPTSSSVKPISSSVKPISSSVKPLSSSAKPISSSAKPLSSSAKPTSSSTKPTPTKPTTAKPSTKIPTTSLDAVYESEIEKRKHETEINLNKNAIKPLKKDSNSKPSAWHTAIITIIVLALCVLVAYLAANARTARGRQTLARLRGRVARDPEVTYLNAAVDDDL